MGSLIVVRSIKLCVLAKDWGVVLSTEAWRTGTFAGGS